MAKKIKKAPLKRHYSGNHSKRFWSRVNALPNDDIRSAQVYVLGCELQNRESDVLQYLELLEKEIK